MMAMQQGGRSLDAEVTKWRALILASRPATLFAAAGPVVVGTALGLRLADAPPAAMGQSLAIAALALICAALMQVGANLVNDVRDAERGIDGEDRLGPRRATQMGYLRPSEVRAAYRLVFALALIGGLVLAVMTGPLVVWLAAICIAMAYLYTAGPLPFSHYACGEVVALLFFGPVAVAGSAYLQTLHWDWQVFAWGTGPGFLAASMMAINNFRDRRSDQRAGKLTLALLVGETRARQLPTVFLAMAIAVGLAYGIVSGGFAEAAIAALASGVVAHRIARLLSPREPIREAASCNTALRQTAKFNLLYAALFAWVVLWSM